MTIAGAAAAMVVAAAMAAVDMIVVTMTAGAVEVVSHRPLVLNSVCYDVFL